MSQLDELDERIIELLTTDGRMSNREIARQLPLTEAAVGNRIRRLTRENVVRVVAVADLFALGYDLLVSVATEAAGRPPRDVAADLAELPRVLACCIVAGAHDLEILVAAENHVDLGSFITEHLSSVEGVRRVSPSLVLDLVKYQTSWTPFLS
jgi:DNA-binding Lrp family transcriptional regulator